MFSNNVGRFDRALRILVGIAMLVAFFLMPDATYRWALLIGFISLATSLSGTCPAYTLLGVRTCKMKR